MGEEEAWSLVSEDEPVSGLGCRAPRSSEEEEEAWSLVLGNEPGPGVWPAGHPGQRGGLMPSLQEGGLFAGQVAAWFRGCGPRPWVREAELELGAQSVLEVALWRRTRTPGLQEPQAERLSWHRGGGSPGLRVARGQGGV